MRVSLGDGAKAMVMTLGCSALTGKLRHTPFPKKANFRAEGGLELVHGNVCGPISPATDGGRRYFLLLVDDCTIVSIQRVQAVAEAECGRPFHIFRTYQPCNR